MNWDSLLGGAANAASGGILGLFGSLATGIVSIFQARAQFKHDEAMADLELKKIEMNTEAQKQMNADQLKALQETQAGEAFKASQIAGNSFSSAPTWASGLLSLFRPTITLTFIGLTLYFYNTTQLADTRLIIINSVLALTGMAVGWWFGDRQISKMVAGQVLPPKDA